MEDGGRSEAPPPRPPSPLRRLRRFLRPACFARAFAWLTVGLAFELLMPQIAGDAVNFLRGADPGRAWRPGSLLAALLGAIGASAPPGGVLFFAELLLVLALLRAWADYRYHLARVRTVQTALSDLRVAVFDKAQRMGISASSAFGAGDLIARATRDVTKTREFFAQVFFLGWDVAFSFLGSAILVFAVHPLLALASLLPAPATLAMLVLFSARARVRWLRSNDRYGELATALQENVAGARVVRAFGREEEGRRLYRFHAEAYLDAYLDAVRYVSARMPLAQFFFGASVPVALGVGAWLVIRQEVLVGDVVKVLLYLMAMVNRMRHVGQIVSGAQVASASAARIFEVLDTPDAVAEPASPRPLPAGGGRIRLEGVSAGYGGREVLSGLDLEIRAGEWVAIVGGMGSGKTTLLRLVPRLLDPRGGRLLLDGEDLRDLRLADLRRAVGYVPQDAFLFSDTIRANIAYGRPDAGDGEVREAARIALADEFVGALDGGYDALVGERGVTLSGGQRQRVALARAVLLKPRVLLLDDPTSAVDAATERQIMDNLRALKGTRTVLFVTHRAGCARHADRVLFLERGRLIEAGAPEELLASSAPYRRFVERQAVLG